MWGSSYLRWRHSRGFGVHSPFAYRIVRDVINPSPGRYAYYGYSRILRAEERMKPRPGLQAVKDASLLLRLANRLKAKRVIAAGNPDSLDRTVAQILEKPYLSIKPGNLTEKSSAGDICVFHGPATADENMADICHLLDKGVSVIAFDAPRELAAKLEMPRTDGVTFIGKRIIIAIPRPEMAFVSYSMKF